MQWSSHLRDAALWPSQPGSPQPQGHPFVPVERHKQHTFVGVGEDPCLLRSQGITRHEAHAQAWLWVWTGTAHWVSEH